MLESAAAHVMQKLLQAADLCNGAVAEGFEFVVGRCAFANVTSDDTGGVVGREPRIRQRPGGRSTFHRAVGILNSKRRSKNRRVGDFRIRRKGFGPITAVEE